MRSKELKSLDANWEKNAMLLKKVMFDGWSVADAGRELELNPVTANVCLALAKNRVVLDEILGRFEKRREDLKDDGHQDREINEVRGVALALAWLSSRQSGVIEGARVRTVLSDSICFTGSNHTI